MKSCPVYASQVEREQLSASQSLPGTCDIEACGECQPLPHIVKELPVAASFHFILQPE